MNPFERALEVLDERGWHQGSFQSHNGQLCVLGALSKAIRVSFVDTCFSPEAVFLGAICGDAPQSFNDDPATSEEDVRLLLKHAAAAWDEKHQ